MRANTFNHELTTENIAALVAIAVISLTAINIIFTGVGPLQAATFIGGVIAAAYKAFHFMIDVICFAFSKIVGDVWML